MSVKDKVELRLLRNVGNECEIQLNDGNVIYGTLDGFRLGEDELYLSVDIPFSNGKQESIINFHYVTVIRFKRR
jgi:hypothetical protein